MATVLDRQGFANRQWESVKAARKERAAKRQADEKWMRSFDPNTAERKDFTRFREGIKKQALDLVGPTQGGLLNTRQAKLFDSLYHDPYRKMMHSYRTTNPKSYAGHFPIASGLQSLIPAIMKRAVGAVSGIPFLGEMLGGGEQEDMTGNYDYLRDRPTRLMTQPENMSDELFELISEDNPYDAWYSQFFPMNVPDYFYQFMDDEVLPYKLGLR